MDTQPPRAINRADTRIALWSFALAAALLANPASAQDFLLNTEYQNLWIVPDLGDGTYRHYFDTNTLASTAVFGGSVLDNTTNALLPNDGMRYGLVSSSLGQTVASTLSDVGMGDVILPPTGYPTNVPPVNFTPVIAGAGTNISYYESPGGGAFYVPSKGLVIASQPNNVEIVWTNRAGRSRTQVVNVSAVSSRRPSKLFWTEKPYDAPVVDLSGLFPVIHYNSEVPPPTYDIVTSTNGGLVTTTTNIISGVWLDDQKQLHAVNVDGTFLIEYFVTGNYVQQVPGTGVEVIRVLSPEIQIIEADMGERLLPQDSFWADADGIRGVIPDTTRSDTEIVLVYGQESPKKNWAFPLRRTTEDPWSLEIYWKQTGLMGVQWPYEVDWYLVDWPDHPQLYVIGDNGLADQPGVLIPNDITARVLPDMDPTLHAKLSDSGKSFTASEPGISMVQYQNHTNIWFDVIRSVSHTNTAIFNLDPEEWEIGQELTPGAEQAHALAMDGDDDFVSVQDAYLNRRNNWTLSFWFRPDALRNATLFSEGSASQPAFNLNPTVDGQLEIETWHAGSRMTFTTPETPVTPGTWQHVAVTYSNPNTATGTLSLYLGDYAVSFDGMPPVSFDGDDQVHLGAQSVSPPGGFFQGRMDDVRVWSVALTAEQISSNLYTLDPATSDSLIAWFRMDEGEGLVLNNSAGDARGTLEGDPTWTYGQVIPDDSWDGFPGYLHPAAGTRYHIGYYAYPTEADPSQPSHIFAVNAGELEVWWANQSRNADMPAVYYPSRVVRYTNAWPANPSQIVIASGLGSSMDQPAGAETWDPARAPDAAIYYQNLPELDGYNPNEEHALILDGVVYALRDDLNDASSSLPYVLVSYTDVLTGLPAMHVFQIFEENDVYRFERDVTAGLPIVPILPLGAFPPALSTTSDNAPPAWQDRKLAWWAVAAGNDGGTADTIMRFYYAVQPGFWFPALGENQPPIGLEVPWLPTADTVADGGATGTPIVFTYHVSWPQDVPKLKLGQTLTVSTDGLPDLWDQLSAAVAYQQSEHQSTPRESVILFDPVVAHRVALDSAVIDAMTAGEKARVEIATGRVRFPELPPSLYPRLYYDPAARQLVLEGQRVETLTGAGYLLLNMLEDYEVSAAVAAASGIDPALHSEWSSAINLLPREVTPIAPNQPYVNAALGARLSEGSGYVTLAFNNSTNEHRVPSSLPVSLSVLQVDTNLYSGELEVLEPADVLAEQLSLRISADFAGQAGQVAYRWKWVNPVGGLPPASGFEEWNTYGPDPVQGTNEVTIAGASPFTLADHFFAVQYRPLDTNGPSGGAWSDWTYNLAPGWVVRAMTGINPFLQAFQDKLENTVDTRSTMISEAGGPYEGDIALNLEAANEAGLIPTYETIFNRAREFSLLVGLADDDINQTLLFAASRLHDLYALLGNEAFADAQNPVVGYPAPLQEMGAFLAANGTALFPFMNQVPNQLEEELALLRGRDDTLLPAVTTSPVYNRLIWNFTQGINGGEAAYAYSYNVRGDPDATEGIITAEDAKALYPQGHGDAWGHYLSAIDHYYELLANPIFNWNTEAGATLLGNATVSTDFLDEQKFAETAAARARTGALVVQQTFRKWYLEDTAGDWPGYHDANTNRAWGVADWASRAGQAALYDWATVNSLMVTTLTNLTQINPLAESRPPEGIERIDRESTPELHEITAQFERIQSQMDSANGGLNPLGLARDAVPFDISPSSIDEGETHFEQIYDRALQAVLNAVAAYDNARAATLELRRQYDSVGDLAEGLAASETDYHNRLIEIFGYPYSDDIGPTGTYPQGYDGPDLINWQIVNIENLVANAPTNTQAIEVEVYDLGFTSNSDFDGNEYKDYQGLTGTRTSNSVATITVTVNSDGFRVKPPNWTGARRAPGELQLAISDYIQAWYGLSAKKEVYGQTMEDLEVQVEHLLSTYKYVSGSDGAWAQTIEKGTFALESEQILKGLKVLAEDAYSLGRFKAELAAMQYGLFPEHVEGIVGGFPSAEVESKLGGIPALVLLTAGWVETLSGLVFESTSYGVEVAKAVREYELEELVTNHQFKGDLKWPTEDLNVRLRSQYSSLADLQSQAEAVSQAQQRIASLLAEGQRLFFERGQVRSRASQRIQTARYADLGFRLFRHDALRRYQSTFDLAARYVYLAAKAYDYETGLLASDPTLTPGNRFLEQVMRARLPGALSAWLGIPVVGSGAAGEPGLTDILARMRADWEVVKGRFGFNNPDTEASRFSLRTELFRTAPDSSGDAAWAQVLENHVVDDLNALPEFRRFCRPYSDSTNAEPGIVISFPTYVIAGKNFFGMDLAAGDNAYDASHASTKIRSVGVWFTGYNNAATNGGGLANEPRVYLVPAGLDILRSPTGGASSTRSYNVVPQSVPLPYNVGGADIDDPDWSPVVDSLREPFGQARKFGSFRAYHDSGDFDSSETISNGRLVGRSVWNTQWMLIIPGRTLLNDPQEGIERFIYGAKTAGGREGNGVTDIKLFFQTYSVSGD